MNEMTEKEVIMFNIRQALNDGEVTREDVEWRDFANGCVSRRY